MPAEEHNHNHNNKDLKEEYSIKHNKEKFEITINFIYNINIGNKEIHIEQRAEGGGQINRNVGMNANQGGQNAKNHSQTANNQSQFADGNGRSGIAGNNNDELGGQQGIKVRESDVIDSIIASVSDHFETTDNEDSEINDDHSE